MVVVVVGNWHQKMGAAMDMFMDVNRDRDRDMDSGKGGISSSSGFCMKRGISGGIMSGYKPQRNYLVNRLKIFPDFSSLEKKRNTC